MATHYLTLIQLARHQAEQLVELLDQLPADYLAEAVARAEFRLAAGLEALAALPPDPLRGTHLVHEMAGRAARAIATVRARLDRLNLEAAGGR